MTKEDNFLNFQKKFFQDNHPGMTIGNHQQHNADPEYWNILLKDIIRNPSFWENKIALDFGCGCGRNIKNLLDLANFERVDGCDISKLNAEYSKLYVDNHHSGKTHTWEVNGKDLHPAKDFTYDFVMSHIVFQHIPNYSIRFSILKDIYRVLKSGGIASLHFLDLGPEATYFENKYEFGNCIVGNPEYLINDFKSIGFKDVTCEVGTCIFINKNNYYIRGVK